MKQLFLIFNIIMLGCGFNQLKAQGFSNQILGNPGGVQCILVDEDTAWLAMVHGILKVNLINHNVLWYNTNNQNFRSNLFVNIKKDKKGNLWFINNQGQVIEYDHQTFISRNPGTKYLNESSPNRSFLEVDQTGKIYHFSHNENVDFVVDSLKIVIRDSNNVTNYNSPEIFSRSCFAPDSLGVFILSDSSNNLRYIKHFKNGVIDSSFPVFRVTNSDNCEIFLKDTIIYYYNRYSYGNWPTWTRSATLLRYSINGTYIDSLHIPCEALYPEVNPKTNEIYFFSQNFQPDCYVDSAGNLQSIPSNPLFKYVRASHFDKNGKLYLAYQANKTHLTVIDTNGISTNYQLPYPIQFGVVSIESIYPIYDSSIVVSYTYNNSGTAILFDGITATEIPPVTNKFVMDSTNTFYFLKNDTIIKYKNGVTFFKTKIPNVGSTPNIKLLYEKGDSIYFHNNTQFYAYNINTGVLSNPITLGTGFIALSKYNELFFWEQSSEFYWMRDSNYVWYKLDSISTGIPNHIIKKTASPVHCNDGSSWFNTSNKIIKRDAVGIWTLYNYSVPKQSQPSNSHIIGGFFDAGHQCHWIISNGLVLKIDSIGIVKYNWKNSNVSYSSFNKGILTNDGKYWLTTGDGSFTRMSIDSLIENPIYQKLQVSGNVYQDVNSNTTIDSIDVPLPYLKLKNEKGVSSYSNLLGEYNFYEPPGQHLIQPDPNSYLVFSCDSHSYTFNVDSIAIDSLDFAFKSISDTLLYASSFSPSQARCSATSSAHIVVRNNGNVKINVFVSFTPDIQSSILSYSSIPDSTNGNTLFWKIDSLKLLESKNITISYTVPSVLFNEIKSIVSFSVYDSVNIIPYKTDTLTQTIRCSFDPNEKQVSPIGMGSAHYTLFSDTLIYTLLFQNTGNDTAFSVLLIDTLSPHLDIESFNLLSMSHNGEVSIDENRVLRAKFNEINLLWESVNSLASQGYIQFSILPKQNLPEFTLVKNNALIVFDYNPYILTNEVFNTFVTTYPTTAVNQLQKDTSKISIYPNPSKNYFSISFDQTVNSEYDVTLFDVSGKILQSWKSKEQNPTFSVESLNAGFYLIQVTNKFDFKAIAKFIKQ